MLLLFYQLITGHYQLRQIKNNITKCLSEKYDCGRANKDK